MSLSPQSNLRIAQLRSALLSGQELSVEELREAIELMRSARGQAHTSAAEGKAKRQSVKSINSDALLDDLAGL